MDGTHCRGLRHRIQFVPTNPPPRQLVPRSPESVQTFDVRPPERPFVEIGMLEARRKSAYSSADMADIVAAMRKEAGKKGCDALVITGTADEVMGSGSTFRGTGAMEVTTLKGYRGSCIVFTGPAPAESPAVRMMPPPEGAVGVRFGDGADAGRQACNSRGFEWSPEGAGFRCGGLPPEIGLTGYSLHSFCDGRACEIDLISAVSESDESALNARWLGAMAKLEERYGRPLKDESVRAATCAPGQLAECLRLKTAAYTVRWVWDNGPRVSLLLGGGGSEITLKVVYESAERISRAGVSGF